VRNLSAAETASWSCCHSVSCAGRSANGLNTPEVVSGHKKRQYHMFVHRRLDRLPLGSVFQGVIALENAFRTRTRIGYLWLVLFFLTTIHSLGRPVSQIDLNRITWLCFDLERRSDAHPLDRYGHFASISRTACGRSAPNPWRYPRQAKSRAAPQKPRLHPLILVAPRSIRQHAIIGHLGSHLSGPGDVDSKKENTDH
jgi:hypothetical protein